MEHQTFVGDLGEIPLGQEIELVVQDLTPGPRKYDSRRVEAILSGEIEPPGDSLLVRSRSGNPYPVRFGIRILKELLLVD